MRFTKQKKCLSLPRGLKSQCDGQLRHLGDPVLGGRVFREQDAGLSSCCCCSALDAVDVVNPIVGGLPDDGADPQRQVGGHKVDEAEPRE